MNRERPEHDFARVSFWAPRLREPEKLGQGGSIK
jgi:hypothetical protein